MAQRMKMRGALGVVVLGRARDAGEISKMGFPVWSRGQSTVGAGAQAIPWTVDGDIQYMGTRIQPVSVTRWSDGAACSGTVADIDVRVISCLRIRMKAWLSFQEESWMR